MGRACNPVNALEKPDLQTADRSGILANYAVDIANAVHRES